MKRVFIALTLILLIAPLYAPAALAIDVESEQSAALGIPEIESAVPDEAADIMGGISVMDSLDLDSAFKSILNSLSKNADGIICSGLASAAKILVIVSLCAVTASVYDGGSVPDYVPLGGVLAISILAIGDVRSFIGLGVETIRSLSVFSKVLLPGLAAAAAAAGAVTSASAKYIAASMFFDVLLTASSSAVIPLLYAYIAAVIANAATGSDALTACAAILKWLCSTIITVLVLAFTLYLSLTSIISGTSDAAVTRMAKTAISSVLPVVGSIVADAASTVVAGAAGLRNAVGIFGLLAVLCVCLLPFLTLGTHYLCYKGAAGLSAMMPDKRLSSLISGIGTAFGIVMAVVGSGCVMLFFSIISSIKAVTG